MISYKKKSISLNHHINRKSFVVGTLIFENQASSFKIVYSRLTYLRKLENRAYFTDLRKLRKKTTMKEMM